MSLITFQNKSDGDFLTTNDVNEIKSIVNLHYTSFIAPMQSQIGALYSAGAAENTFTGLNDTPSDFNAGKYLRVNSAGDSIEYADIAGGGGGSTTFVGLSDTPSSFTANKYLRVNSAGDALEYVDIAGGGGGGEEASYISNGTVSGYYDTNNNFRYNHHIIPESNANFDLGSAEYKIRHLYLSSNSLWIGDEAKISSSEGKLSVLQRDKDKLPSYITGLGGSLEDAYMFLNVDYANEITLAGLEEYAKSLDPTADLSKIFPVPTDPGFNENDYSDIFKVNKNQNQRKKIYIKYDNATLAPSIPTLDLREHTDFEFYIDNGVAPAIDSQLGEIKVKLITSGYKLSKFNIYFARPESEDLDNGFLFASSMYLPAILIDNAAPGDLYYKIPTNNGNPRDISPPSQYQSCVIECTHVDNNTAVAGEEIMSDIYDPTNQNYTAYKIIIDGTDYYWLSSFTPTPGPPQYGAQSMVNGDYQIWLYEDLTFNVGNDPADYSQLVNITVDQLLLNPDVNDITYNGSTISNVNVIDSISWASNSTDVKGQLYSNYFYYGNTNDMEDSRGI